VTRTLGHGKIDLIQPGVSSRLAGMDNDLKQKFAPRRNKRYAHLRRFHEEAAWANTLDWKTNDYDFYRLTRAILDYLGSDFREKCGIRVDQLADRAEIRDCFRTCRRLYQEEERLFQRLGIYGFLHVNLELWLGGKACHVMDARREAAERLIRESDAA